MTRREDFRLVSGRGCYTADWNLPQQLHAAFLRADRAHAEIVSLDASGALACDGVRAVITADDVKAAGFKSLPNTVNYPGKDGQQIRKPFYPVLATGRVRHVGEAIAMVVADTAEIAEDARELDRRSNTAICRLPARSTTPCSPARPNCTKASPGISRSSSTPAMHRRSRRRSDAPNT